MFKIFIGIIIGIMIVEFNIMSEMLDLYNKSGLNDLTNETLEGLRK